MSYTNVNDYPLINPLKERKSQLADFYKANSI